MQSESKSHVPSAATESRRHATAVRLVGPIVSASGTTDQELPCSKNCLCIRRLFQGSMASRSWKLGQKVPILRAGIGRRS